MPMGYPQPSCQSLSLAIMVLACMFTSLFGLMESRYLQVTDMLICLKMRSIT